MDALFEIELDLPPSGSRRSSRILYEQLRAAITAGRLAAGARLPPMRRAVTAFGVSRNTVASVYNRLASEGLVIARPGAGVFIAARQARRSRPVARSPGYVVNPVWLQQDIARDLGFWGLSSPHAAHAAAGSSLDFRPGTVDLRLFPFDVFRRVMAGELRRFERRLWPGPQKSPQSNQGNLRLREALSRHVAVTRGVACLPEDVVITAGAQQGFDLLARVLVTPGETTVALEDPGYPPMRAAFAAAGARVAPVRVDREGLVVDEIPANARIICVCPSHQFPLGVALSRKRRAQLQARARESGAVIVEDDYDGEFRFEGAPLRALWTEATRDIVFYVGTLSKCMFPALRLGFVVAPQWALKPLIAAKNCSDWHCPTPLQLATAAFLSESHLVRHALKMRDIYRARRALLLDGIRSELGKWVQPLPSYYGMHVAAVARPGVDCEAAITSLARFNVHAHSLTRYCMARSDWRGFVLSYALTGLDEIEDGLARIRAVLAAR